MFGSDDKDKMHPQDLRNMFIFFVLAALIYFTFDALVLKPQNAALQKKRVVEQQIKKVEEAKKQQPLPPKPRALVLQESSRITLDNGKITGSIELRGARIDDIAFDDYYDTIEKKNKVVLLSPKNTEFPRYIEYGWVADDKNLAVPGPDTVWRTEGNSRLAPGNPVTLAWENGQGVRFENIYSIDENYAIALTQKVVNNSGRGITLNPYGLISQTGVPPGFHPVWIVHEGPVGFIGKKLEELSYASLHKEPSHSYDAERGWLGITDKYWLTALIPPQDKQVHYRYTYSGTTPKNSREKDTGKYQVDFLQPAMTVEAGHSAESTSHIYTGVKKVVLLQEYGKKLNIPNFDLAVDFGWFWFMTKPFFFGLQYLGQWIGNMGVAIICMTLIIRMAVFPLTNI
ncbi:MAG: membrane protein insertase YidC, partial [Alphaproteobacteria bacterium]|nr:membrane protein insertase YidC [Alphaproteobacteria bacterium]